jgi:hypothetical protein
MHMFKIASHFILNLTMAVPIFNNYSPKARWLSVNKNRDEVDVFILDNHRAWGE